MSISCRRHKFLRSSSVSNQQSVSKSPFPKPQTKPLPTLSVRMDQRMNIICAPLLDFRTGLHCTPVTDTLRKIRIQTTNNVTQRVSEPSSRGSAGRRHLSATPVVSLCDPFRLRTSTCTSNVSAAPFTTAASQTQPNTRKAILVVIYYSCNAAHHTYLSRQPHQQV